METSSRGPLYPDRLPEFHRLAPSATAASLVRWFWISRWHLPPEEVSRQPVIAYPAFNLVVEDSLVALAGPATRASHRDLAGSGWAVGALLWPAATAAFTPDPARHRDRYDAVDAAELHDAVAAAIGEPGAAGREAATRLLSHWLTQRVGEPSEEALAANRLVAAAEESDMLRVGDLAHRLGLSERTLQRLARRYVGLSPAALIRRRRLQEAAERLRAHPDADLAALATDLGYVDQAHLTNDFARILGFTPGRYRREVSTAALTNARQGPSPGG